MRVIIVDDDRELSDLLKKAIWVSFYAKAKTIAKQRQQITEGLEITQFNNSQDALIHLQNANAKVHLIFCEIHASDQEQYKFIQTCSKSLQDKYEVLVVVAERGRQQDADQGIAAGAQACLFKPFTPEDLIKYIFAVWNQNPADGGKSEEKK